MKDERILHDGLSLLNGNGMFETAAVPAMEVEPMRLCDGPAGLRYQETDQDSLGIHASAPATALMSGPAIAASWDPEIALKMGKIIGEEAVSLGVDIVLGPGVNLMRSPLCGRNMEYYSEDPLLAGKMGAGYIRGVKEAGADCCVKHFAANNQETEREYLDVICDETALRELYLKAFEIAVREGKPLAVMTSLSRINGIYCSENRWLLTDVLRREWGFDGIVMTDWMGVYDRAAAIRAGLDLEMPGTGGRSTDIVRRAIARGELEAEAAAAAVRRTASAAALCTARRSRHHSPCTEDERIKMLRDHHQEVTRLAAEAVTLLKNDDRILPVSPSGKESIAVIGAYARHPLYQAQGSGRVEAAFEESVLENMEKVFGADRIRYADGYVPENRITENERQSYADEAAAAAAGADIAIVFLAADACLEGEGHDRTDYSLPGYQVDVLRRVSAVSSRTVAVVMNGGAVSMPWAEEVKGILECYYGGQGIGAALADIIAGLAEPGGRLPYSVPYRMEHIISWENYAARAESVTYHEGLMMGYRGYCTKGVPVQWPFGYGLSYTSFEIDSVTSDRTSICEKDEILVNVSIRNTGKRSGSQVIQVYVENAQGRIPRPVRELRSFKKIRLDAGEKMNVQIVLSADDFKVYDSWTKRRELPAGNYRIAVGFSCEDIRQRLDITAVPGHPVPEPMIIWDKTSRLMETAVGREIFENLYQCIRANNDGFGALFGVTGEGLRERLLDSPLRIVHLMAFTELSGDDVTLLVKRFNDSLIQADGGHSDTEVRQ